MESKMIDSTKDRATIEATIDLLDSDFASAKGSKTRSASKREMERASTNGSSYTRHTRGPHNRARPLAMKVSANSRVAAASSK